MDENNNYVIAAEMLMELDEIHRVYWWVEEWKCKDKNGEDLYKGQPMWCIRLGDKNELLSSLYIYIDAENGNVLGAGRSSD